MTLRECQVQKIQFGPSNSVATIDAMFEMVNSMYENQKKNATPPVKETPKKAEKPKPETPKVNGTAKTQPNGTTKPKQQESTTAEKTTQSGYKEGDWVQINTEAGIIRGRIASETETNGEWFVSLRKGSLQRIHQRYFVQ